MLYEPPEARQRTSESDRDATRETYSAPDLAVPAARSRVAPRRRWWLPFVLLLLVLAAAALGFWLKPVPPLVAIDTPGVGFDTVRLGAVATRAVDVVNQGGRRLTLEKASLRVDGREPDNAFSITHDACADQLLPPAGRCTVTVAFAPRNRGLHSAIVEVTGDAANGPAAVMMVGQGIAPEVVLEPSELRFSGLPVGTSGTPQRLRVRNDGSSPLVVTKVEVEGLAAQDYQLAEDQCTGQTLARGDDCRVRVDFSPTAEGERPASLWVRSDAPDGSLSVPIMGRGLAQEPLLSVDVVALDLGAVAMGATTDPATITLTNDGSGPLTVRSVELRGASATPGSEAPGSDVPSSERPGDGPPGGDPAGDPSAKQGTFVLNAEACTASPVAPGGRCLVTVVYTALRSGAATTSVVIAHSADETDMVVPVRAMGLAPGLRMVPLRLNFGAVPMTRPSAPQRVTFENTGMAPLRLESLRVEGADATAFGLDAGTCEVAELEPGASCHASLQLRPAREGTLAAELVVRHNATGGEERIPITGEGLAPRLELDTARLDYGGLTLGSRRDLSLTLRNEGRAPLRLAQVSLSGLSREAFGTVSNRCANTTLEPDERCVVTIRFEPVAEGAQRAELVITAPDLGTRRVVPLTGIGLPRPAPNASVDPGAYDFGPMTVGRRGEIATVTVRNTGTGPMTLSDFRLSGPQATSFEVVLGSCERGAVVAAGNSCTIGVRFVPSQTGTLVATLTLRHNAGRGQDQVNLRGTGLDPAPPVTPGSGS